MMVILIFIKLKVHINFKDPEFYFKEFGFYRNNGNDNDGDNSSRRSN
jgi:hypothetical protein